MLKVCSPVEDFLQQVLGVPLDLFLVVVYKSLEVAQALAEECLELVPHDMDKVVYVLFPLILLLAEIDLVPKKRCGKKNLVSLFRSSDSKVVIILLTEVVALYVGLFTIYIQGTEF